MINSVNEPIRQTDLMHTILINWLWLTSPKVCETGNDINKYCFVLRIFSRTFVTGDGKVKVAMGKACFESPFGKCNFSS